MSDNNFVSIVIIAGNEFKRYLFSPLVLVIISVLMVFIMLNGMYVAPNLVYNNEFPDNDPFYLGLSQIFYYTVTFCTTLAVFLGAVSISEEIPKNSLKLLLTKPIYRKDVITGKFIGINLFMLLFIGMTILLTCVLISFFFRPPLSILDFVQRIGSYILIIFLQCSIAIGISMLISNIFKEMLLTTMLSISYLYFQWYNPVLSDLGNMSFISPSYLLCTLISFSWGSFFVTSVPYGSWLSKSFPYILLMILETILLYLVNCYVFSRSDNI